jgi:hypothetical protein
VIEHSDVYVAEDIRPVDVVGVEMRKIPKIHGTGLALKDSKQSSVIFIA